MVRNSRTSSRSLQIGTSTEHTQESDHQEEMNEDPIHTAQEPEFWDLDIQDLAHRRRFRDLSHLEFLNSRFVAADIHPLGIYENVIQLLDNIGWTHALATPRRAYQQGALEILSTVDVTDYGRHREPQGISFRFGNRDWTLSVVEINAIFQCPNGGLFRESHTSEFWDDIVEPEYRPYSSRTSKATMIRNPVFRYLQRVMASTILARQENTGVRTMELFILRCMLSNTAVNFGSIFCAHMVHIGNKYTGGITIGGMLTPIMEYIDQRRVSMFLPIPGDTAVHLGNLQMMRFLVADSTHSRFILKQRSGDHFPLPRPMLTYVSTLQSKDNWLMNTAAHIAWREHQMDPQAELPHQPHQPQQPQQPQPYAPFGEGTSRSAGHRRMRDDFMEDRMTAFDDRLSRVESITRSMNLRQREMYDQQTLMYNMMREWNTNFFIPQQPPHPPSDAEE